MRSKEDVQAEGEKKNRYFGEKFQTSKTIVPNDFENNCKKQGFHNRF